jgi:hypothetical protein
MLLLFCELEKCKISNAIILSVWGIILPILESMLMWEDK